MCGGIGGRGGGRGRVPGWWGLAGLRRRGRGGEAGERLWGTGDDIHAPVTLR